MIEAFIQAFGDRNDVELRLVGSGDMIEYLRSKYSSNNNIIFVGAKFGNELIIEYHNASALILPSSSEQW